MIKKIDWLNLFKKLFPYLVVIICALLSTYIYFLPGLATGDDIAFHLSMTNDLIYGFHHGYFSYSTNHLHMGGFAIFNFAFYGPVTHYGAAIFTYLFSWMGATPTVGLKFMVFISAILGGIYMYRLASKISNKHTPLSLISAVLFTFLPYRIFCALARCALAESIAMALIPMVFYGAYSFIHDEEYRVEPYVAFASGAILIILSHAFTGLITAIFGVLYILFNIKAIIKRRRNYEALISIGSAVVIIIFCVLFYVLNSYFYENSNLYNISNAERQWTTYEHMASETSRTYDFSGFINFIIIRNWTGSANWNNETVSSLIFSSIIFFISLALAIIADLLLGKLKYSKYYRHISATIIAFILPLIFQVRAEIYLATAIALVIYFFISYIIKSLPESNEENISLIKNVDLYFLSLSLIICLVLLFVPEAWKFVPPIMYQGQFAWRMWSITGFLFVMLVTLLLSKVKFNKAVITIASVITCSLMTFAMGTIEKRVFYEKRYNSVILNDGYEYAMNIKYSGAQNEMIPQVFYQSDYASSYSNSLYSTIRSAIYSRTNYIYSLEDYIDPVLLDGTGDVTIYEYNSPNNKFHVNITSETALVQFPQFYYADYTAISNNKVIAKAENVDGLLSFTLKEGTYDIALNFKPSKGYQITIPLFYIGVNLLIAGGVFGYIYRTKIKKPIIKEEPTN